MRVSGQPISSKDAHRSRLETGLHTHSISVVQVQAGVAVHLTRKRGEEVSPALLAIAEAGADAARELRDPGRAQEPR
jgi:hypothetical protein